MSKLLDVLTELENPVFTAMYNDKRLLKDYPDDKAPDLIYHVINRMAMEFGGIHKFWDEEDEESALLGWVNGLRLITAKQLFNTLYQVLTGKYTKLPISVAEFKGLMYQGTHHQLAPSVEETMSQSIFGQMQICGENPELARERSNEARKLAMGKLRGVLPRG